MSFLDKIAATLAPPESDEDRAEAHREAKALAANNDWLARALSHHEQIEAGFASALNASLEAEAKQAAKELAIRAREMPLTTGLRMEQVVNRLLAFTEDAAEGSSAFADKRAPEFRGR